MDDLFGDDFGLDPLPRRRKRKQSVSALPPEEEQGIVAKLAGTTMSGLGKLFSVLDLPASSVRDALALNNPFDQWLDPFGSEAEKNRVTGRDMLSTWGLASQNKETGIGGWVDDPMEGVQDVAGFAAEVALDPLGWLAKGGKAMTRTGQAVREAGLLKKAEKVGAARGKGRREAFMEITPRELTNPLPAGAAGPQTEDFLKFASAAEARGLDPMAELDTPLAGLYGVVKPFGVDPFMTIGQKGGVAQKVARAKDKVEEAIRYGNIPGTNYSPGRQVASLFSAPAMGAKTTAGQKFASEVYDAVGEGQREAKQFSTEHALNLSETMMPITRGGAPVSWASEDARKAFRLMGEGIVPYDPAFDPTGSLAATMQMNERLLEGNAVRGIKAGRALDDTVGLTQTTTPLIPQYVNGAPLPSGRKLGYLARRSTVPSIVKRYAEGKPYASMDDLAGKKRDQIFKGFTGGTEQINALMVDPAIKQILQTAPPAGVRKQIADHIKKVWGPRGVEITYKEKLPNGKLQSKDRAAQLADFIYEHPDVTESGLFNQHFIADAHSKIASDLARQKVADKVFDFFGDPANTFRKPAGATREQSGVRVGSVLKKLGFDLRAATDQILERHGFDIKAMEAADPKAAARIRKSLRDGRVKSDVARDILKAASTISVPDEIGDLGKAVDSATALFKAGVLTHPARYVRDLFSGQMRNVERGEFSRASFSDAKNLLLGQTVEGAEKIPAVQRWLAERGQPATAENATRALKIMYGSLTGGSTLKQELTGARTTQEGIDALLDAVPGKTPTTMGGAIRDTLKDAKDKGSWKPWDIAGVGDRTETKFKPVRIGNTIGQATDDMNRIVPWLEKLKAGADPVAAMDQVNVSQVDYSPRTFTTLERQLKRVFPFYSFGSRQAKYVANELMQHPGGRMGQTIRATASGQNPDEIVPESIADTATIPLGTLPDGSKRYLTGFGLMHEDPLGFLGGGVRGAGLELLSRANPLVKGPLEWFTGQSFFQKGPDGGRPLEDLDPTIGRIISNVRGDDRPAKTPDWLEAIVGNSPLSRLATTVRTATDRRKWDEAGLLNLLSGVRVSDISPAAQDAQLREATQGALRKLGSRTFQKVFVPEEIKDKMDPQELKAVGELEALLNELARRSKDRKETKRKEK